MDRGLSWIMVWQSAVPIVVGILSVLLSSWLPHAWGRTAAARSARVAARLGDAPATKVPLS
jgi:hypothetical protein